MKIEDKTLYKAIVKVLSKEGRELIDKRIDEYLSKPDVCTCKNVINYANKDFHNKDCPVVKLDVKHIHNYNPSGICAYENGLIHYKPDVRKECVWSLCNETNTEIWCDTHKETHCKPLKEPVCSGCTCSCHNFLIGDKGMIKHAKMCPPPKQEKLKIQQGQMYGYQIGKDFYRATPEHLYKNETLIEPSPQPKDWEKGLDHIHAILDDYGSDENWYKGSEIKDFIRNLLSQERHDHEIIVNTLIEERDDHLNKWNITKLKLSSERKEIIEKVKKVFYRGCTMDEVVPRLDELLKELEKSE